MSAGTTSGCVLRIYLSILHHSVSQYDGCDPSHALHDHFTIGHASACRKTVRATRFTFVF
ncbi:hypothetical protein ASG25_17520 [Rhizobium sp. Leaf384]|nr:hypothetical protein ASG03_09485 [Rhizobium sp. Leaf341]KQS77163.1 hypothetical protein ASG25_17520 [Rhizobium sp. Leaf384]KQS84855.1 hypothetical protein ASG58_20400 [Rhizobium sp. Leaf383]